MKVYQEAITDLSEEQKKFLGLSPDPKARHGRFSSLLKFAEWATSRKQGATKCYLSAMSCHLDKSADRLRGNYLISINRLVQVAGKTAKEAEQYVIDSRYILLRELLLRLVTVALSDEENRYGSGKPFVAALECFIEKISTTYADTLGLDASFCHDLNLQLPVWVSCGATSRHLTGFCTAINLIKWCRKFFFCFKSQLNG